MIHRIQMNVNQAVFYNTGCCMHQSRWKMKCLKSDSKRLKLIVLKKITQHLLNPTINKTIVLTKANVRYKNTFADFCLLLRVFDLFLSLWLKFHKTQALHTASAMLYQVSYRACLHMELVMWCIMAKVHHLPHNQFVRQGIKTVGTLLLLVFISSGHCREVVCFWKT